MVDASFVDLFGEMQLDFSYARERKTPMDYTPTNDIADVHDEEEKPKRCQYVHWGLRCLSVYTNLVNGRWICCNCLDKKGGPA